MWDEVVDYIVVGAGSAGCAISARLYQGLRGGDDAEESRTSSSVDVLLLEAGDHDCIPQIQTAVDYFGKVESVFGSSRDWLYDSEPQKELNGRGFYWPRGKVVGGCSSFNTMVWLRAPPSDFDLWQDRLGGAKEWGYETMLRMYKRAETHPYAKEKGLVDFHGDSGPIRVAPLNHASHHPDDATNTVTRAFVDAAKRLGVPENPDFGLRTDGVGVNDVNAFEGRRCNAAAYLRMIGAYPEPDSLRIDGIGPFAVTEDGRFKVRTKTMVTKVLFDRDESGAVTDASKRRPPRAVGVEVVVLDEEEEEEEEGDRGLTVNAAVTPTTTQSGDTSIGRPATTPTGVGTATRRRFRIRARREIVCSGGAVNSPQLLLLSGVGDRRHLEDVGVDCVAHVPGVGRSLKDHLHVPICYRVHEPTRVVPHTHSNICEGSLFTTLDANATSPDLQVHIGTLLFDPQCFTPTLDDGFTLTPSLIQPKSVGSLTLRSDDPFERPKIEADYLTDPRDLRTLVRGVKFVRAVGRAMLQTAVSGLVGTEIHPGPFVVSDADIEAYVRNHVGTMYHPTSTCKMGLDDDLEAVVDIHLRVRGVRDLRVCDASVMPEIVGANTNATCVAIGENGAEIILTELGLGHGKQNTGVE
eukprot:g3726.t1